jgi:acetylornithine/succinyldiaminopimelate/putrescine aminotransferase
MRSVSAQRQTLGISNADIESFLDSDKRLLLAIKNAYREFLNLKKTSSDLLRLPESELIEKLQKGYCNFYGKEALKPYVPLAAQGPWVVTTSGAVIFNMGGYGMLSFGYNAPAFKSVLVKDQVMANMMTASFNQEKLMSALKKEIGQNRLECPYSNFISLNSGSEVVTLALTLSDVHSKIQTDPGAPYEGRKIMFLSLEGSFHGRTGRASKLSDSTTKYYECLASFRDDRRLITVPVNDCVALEKIFKKVDEENIYIDSFFMEPVMGEGNPGKAVDPTFYRLARRLTREHDTLLVVDSIQAGFRGTGYMSITDYPGFNRLDAPDMETFAKSINGGEFPVSLLALSERASRLYRKGIYGNTMTGNPRGLEMITTMLEQVTPAIRKNIVERGKELKQLLCDLQREFPEQIFSVEGTGLLLSMSLSPEFCPMMGEKGFEPTIRKQGINVIHGGKNALRFTPCFDISSPQIKLVHRVLQKVFAENSKIHHIGNTSIHRHVSSSLKNAA